MTLLKDSNGTAGNTFTDLDSRISVIQEAPLNVQQREYARLASGADWTAAFAAAKAALPASGGEILVPYVAGGYEITSTITIGKGQHWRGVGGARNANGVTEPFAATQIRFTNNGKGFYVDSSTASDWGLQGFLLIGDDALTSQDLLTIGSGSATFGGLVRDVTCDGAGRDGIVFDFALNVLCERVMARASGRHGWRFTSQANANTLTRCHSTLNQQWGVYYQGGKDNSINMTIESNSQATGTDYGGIRVVGDTWHCLLTLDTCHFENNDGDGGTGVHLKTDIPSNVPTVITDIGSEWGDGPGVILNGGRYTGIGIRSAIQTAHAIIGASHEGAVFVNPRRWGTGAAADGAASFALTDSSGKSIVIGNGITNGKPGIMVGGDTILARDAADTWRFYDTIVQDLTAASTIIRSSRVPGDAQARSYDRVDGFRFHGSGAATQDVTTGRSSAKIFEVSPALRIGGATGEGFMEGDEQSSDPSAPSANRGRLFFKDNGAGKTQLAVRFNSGATQIIATEP